LTQLNNLILVKASIYLLKTEEGGRASGIKTGYRSDHVFEKPKNINDFKSYGGQINFDDQEFFYPGEVKIVTVKFLRNPIVEQFLKAGQKWYIYEGPRFIGEGEILEI